MLGGGAGGRILAMYAQWLDAPAYFTEAQLEQLHGEIRRSLSDAEHALTTFVADTLGADAAGVETAVVEAHPVDGILAQAAESGAGLIVMGTHGRTGWNRWTLGSVAERVLRESAIPVLTVRGAPSAEIRHILCPVSDNGASRAALSRAASVASAFDATVTVVHVTEPNGGGSIPNLCAWVGADARERCTVREMPLRGYAAEEIVRLTKDGEYDLVVLGARRRRFFEGMLMGTTAIRVIRHAACPVLSISETAGVTSAG